MGQIQTVIASGQVQRPASNTSFSISRRLWIARISYRNISCSLPWSVFQQCAAALATLDKERIEKFPYGSNSFSEELATYDLPAIMPEEAARLVRINSSEYQLLYRNIVATLDAAEAGHVAPFLRTEKTAVRGLLVRGWRLVRNAIFLFSQDESISRMVRAVVRRLAPLPKRRPLLWQRFSFDLCENIHIHFQNFRVEFPASEFVLLMNFLSTPKTRQKMKGLWWTVRTDQLPETTEWDKRFQLEEQVEGHFHLHYRNNRVEFTSFDAVGIRFSELPGVRIADEYVRRGFMANHPDFVGIRSVPLKELSCIVYRDEGESRVPIEQSPVYRALAAGDRSTYDAYIRTVLKHDPLCTGRWEKFIELNASIREHGFRDSEVLVARGEPLAITDGQHRASILYYLKGPDFKVKTAVFR